MVILRVGARLVAVDGCECLPEGEGGGNLGLFCAGASGWGALAWFGALWRVSVPRAVGSFGNLAHFREGGRVLGLFCKSGVEVVARCCAVLRRVGWSVRPNAGAFGPSPPPSPPGVEPVDEG